MSAHKRRLRPFGEGGLSYRHGYTLPVLLGHLENLTFMEECEVTRSTVHKRVRLSKVQDACALLQEALEMGGESE